MLCRKTARVFIPLALVSLVLFLGVVIVRPGISLGGTESLLGSSRIVVPVDLYAKQGGGGSPSLKASSEGRATERTARPTTLHGASVNPSTSQDNERAVNSTPQAASTEERGSLSVKTTEEPSHDASTTTAAPPVSVRERPVANQHYVEYGIPDSATVTERGGSLSTEEPSHDASTTTAAPPVSVRERPVANQHYVEYGIPDSATVTAPDASGQLQRPETYTCKLSNCMDALSIQEKSKVKLCERKTVQYVGHTTLEEPTCRFIMGQSSRQPVALNSQEGSGNTWLRGLLEKATGLCTGFYLCDTEMRPQGFLGESVQSGRVLVVKTHVHIPQWVGEKKIPYIAYDSSYSSAVYLIRNPAHGVVTEWNRVITLKKMPSLRQSHTNIISKDEFGTKEWTKFFDEYIYKWRVRTINWVLKSGNHPVHVVSYEDLKRDRVREIGKILDFLQFPYDHDELAERLNKDYTFFQRPHANEEEFQHFSPGEKDKLRAAIESLRTSAKTAGMEHMFLFNEYLQSLPDIP